MGINKLAIVIPYYKMVFFEETLKSVASQTDKRFTLYIGNDASPDDPFPLIEKYFPDRNYHYFDYSENLGGKNLAMQWERILENVNEEWFQILGDDDVISENFVEEFYNHSKNYGSINFIKFASEIVNEKNKIVFSAKDRFSSDYYSIIYFFILKLRREVNSSLSEHIFRIRAYKKTVFKKYPLAWHSDDFFLLDLSQDHPDFYFIDKAKVTIRETDQSVSGSKDNLKQKENASEMFYVDVLKLFKFQKISNIYKDELAKLLIQTRPGMGAKNIYLSLYSFPEALPKLTIFYFRRFLNLLFAYDKKIDILQSKFKKVKYFLSIKLHPLIKNQRKEPLNIPIIIINYNQLFYLKQLVDFLRLRHFKNIIIVDNASTYDPLMEYYKEISFFGITVEHMDKNYGHNVFFENKRLWKKYGQGYYILTDADIVPADTLPLNFMEKMIFYLDKYFNEITKVGLALDTCSIPDHYPLKEKVKKWEKQFWEIELEKNIFFARTDTTFSLYKPKYNYTTRKDFLKAIRIAGNFTSKHGGWYLNPKSYTDEQIFYIKTASKSSSWKLDEKGVHVSAEYDKFLE